MRAQEKTYEEKMKIVCTFVMKHAQVIDDYMFDVCGQWVNTQLPPVEERRNTALQNEKTKLKGQVSQAMATNIW